MKRLPPRSLNQNEMLMAVYGSLMGVSIMAQSKGTLRIRLECPVMADKRSSNHLRATSAYHPASDIPGEVGNVSS